MGAGWQVGIDIGGTFTDVVAIAADGAVRTAKVDTQSDDRLASLLAALEAVGLAWEDVDDLIHGTTMVTNAIVEGKLAAVALVATTGFADTIEIGRQNRAHLYRLDLAPKPAPLVPEGRRFEIEGRIDHRGEELIPLDTAAAATLAERIAATGAEAVAVSLIHAYADPRHEEAVGRALAGRFAHLALSHRINPEAREYERTATTVLSAGLMPLAAGYLDRLEAARPAGSRLHLFHSAGGMAAPATLRARPLTLAMSGPAAGVAAATAIARDLGLAEAISFDMGGTTTDVCLILDGTAMVANDRSLGGRPLRQPMVAVDAIGAGGGSIARIDHGALRVGPESAGANPGPACYGRGGSLPTVSDADLVLGYLDASVPLGGTLRLDLAAAGRAIAPIAAAMGCSLPEVALGIVRVANDAMTQALRRCTVENGIEGRGATLIAYGGAGPMHAVAVAREFGIARVVVPAFSSVFSALGCVRAEMSYAQQQTVRMPVGRWDAAALEAVRAALRDRLAEPLRAAGVADAEIGVEEVALVRYSGQSYAIEVADPRFEDPAALARAFLALHERLYGYSTEEPWQLEAIRLRVFRRGAGAGAPGKAGTEAPVAALPMRPGRCIFGPEGAVATPRHRREGLTAGAQVAGPAVIEDDHSTIVLPPGAVAVADAAGHLHIATETAP